MARNDDSQPSRVYKASDVHKRRVNRKARPEKAPVPDRPAREQVRELEPQAHKPQSQEPASEQPAEGVVLKPEFGRRTEAQREADDRWFAAMREDVPEVIPASPEASAEPQAPAPAESAEPTPVGTAPAAPAGTGRPTPAGTGPAESAETGRSTPVGASSSSPAEQGGATGAGEVQQAPPAQPTEDIPSINADSDSEEAAPPARFGAKAAGAFASREKLSVKRRIVLALTVVIVAAIAVGVGLFTWNRWYRFDDRADMQGEWYVVGTTVPVTVDESSIHLTDDVTYQYEINPQDKTIRYTFGPMEGQGRYWFSDDRQYLVITDGDEFTSTGTAFDDLLHSFGDMADTVTGVDVKLPEGEGVIAFSREPDAQALAREKEEAAKKAAAEEAARKEEERRAAEEAAAEAAEWEEYYEDEYYEEELQEE